MQNVLSGYMVTNEIRTVRAHRFVSLPAVTLLSLM